MKEDEKFIKEDDKFIETVEVGDKVVSRKEGTFRDLVELEKKEHPTLKAPPLSSKADEIIKIAKFTWDIIKDSKAETATESACSRILSAKDDNWQNYGEASDFSSKEKTTYKLDNFVGVNCYTIQFKVIGTCRAKNPNLGGLWIPNVHITFFQCDANWPWIINGSANIDGTYVSNIGTVEEPVPQVVLNVKVATDAKFAFSWESHEKTFEFGLNARDGVKEVS